MHNQIQQKDPTELALHPALAHLPGIVKDNPDEGPFRDNIFEQGILCPLLVVPRENEHGGKLLIVDGRRRWEAAKAWQFKEIPVIVRPAHDAIAIILSTLFCRRHFSKGAQAYLAYPLVKPYWDEAREKKLKNLQKGQQSPETALSAASETPLGKLSREMAVSDRLLRTAKAVHEAFCGDNKRYDFETPTGKEPLTLRQYFEPKLLATPEGGEHENAAFPRWMGLGAVLAGIAGIREGKQPSHAKPAALLAKAWTTFASRFDYWNELDKEAKADHWSAFRSTFMLAPQDYYSALQTQVRELNKARNKAAKKEGK